MQWTGIYSSSKYTSLFTESFVQNYSSQNMNTSNSSSRLSGSSCTPQSNARSSVRELADANSIQVRSSSDSEDQLSDHNEDEAQPEVSITSPKFSKGKQQEQSLEDYNELSVMMQYNYRNDH